MAPRQDAQVDTLRALACILLVAFHVIGAQPGVGLRVEEGFYREINDVLAYLRMPLFTFLSGLVYAYRPFSGSGTSAFLKGKARRLLLPLITVGTTFAVLQSLVPGANKSVTEWYLLHIIPVGHFWFVQSLFLIFLVLVLVERMGGLETPRRFALVLAVACILHLLPLASPYFGISGALYLFPYFLMGMAIQRYGFRPRLTTPVMLAGLGVMLTGLALVYGGWLEAPVRRSVFALVVGVSGCIGLLALGWKSTVLAKLGVYSYSIYLFHVFFTAAARIVMEKVGLTSVHILLLAGVLAGLLFPILVEKILDGTNLTRVACLGKSKKDPASLWLSRRWARQTEPG